MASQPKQSKAAIAKGLVAVFLILSLTGFCTASLLSLHLHILPGGRVVAHSHPLPDNGDEHSHDHTQQEYVALGKIAQILEADELSCGGGLLFFADPCGSVRIDPELSLSLTLVSSIEGRAPPLSSLS